MYADLAFGDLDGDGDGDLLFPLSETFEPETNPARTYVLLSDVFQAPNAPLAFNRGDANGDRAHDLSDAVFVLGYLFGGGETPACLAAADVDDSGEVDISDAVAQLNHFFSGGPPPSSASTSRSA